MWDTESTGALLNLWADSSVQRKLLSVRNRDTWKDLRQRLLEAGYDFTVQQLKDKVRNLTKAYHQAVANRKKSGGSGADYFDWFDVMNSVLGDKPLTAPTHIVDTSAENPLEPASDVSKTTEEDEFIQQANCITLK